MPQNILKTKFSLEVEVIILKEDDYYTAYCPALELSGYGKSIEGAQEAFKEEVEIFFEETTKQGTLERYLLKTGWRIQQNPFPVYEPPRPDTEKLMGLFKSGETTLKRQQVNIPVC